MTDPITAALMSIGTGAAAGLRPYLLVLGLGVTKLLTPAEAPAALSVGVSYIPSLLANPWVLILCAVLALVDQFSDFLPGIDVVVVFVNLFVRPLFATLVGGGIGMETGDHMTIGAAALSTAAAVPVALGKASLTSALTFVPLGPLAPMAIGIFETFGVAGLIAAVLLLPVVAAVLGIALALFGYYLYRKFRAIWRATRTRLSQVKERKAELKALRAAQLASGERVTLAQALRTAASGATPAVAVGFAATSDQLRSMGAAGADWTKRSASTAARASSEFGAAGVDWTKRTAGSAAQATGAAAQAATDGAKRLAGQTGELFRAAQERWTVPQTPPGPIGAVTVPPEMGGPALPPPLRAWPRPSAAQWNAGAHEAQAPGSATSRPTPPADADPYAGLPGPSSAPPPDTPPPGPSPALHQRPAAAPTGTPPTVHSPSEGTGQFDVPPGPSPVLRHGPAAAPADAPPTVHSRPAGTGQLDVPPGSPVPSRREAWGQRAGLSLSALKDQTGKLKGQADKLKDQAGRVKDQASAQWDRLGEQVAQRRERPEGESDDDRPSEPRP